MRVLFVHQNFPGQFRHLAAALANDPTHQVVAIGEAPNLKRQGVCHPRIHRLGYGLDGQRVSTTNPWLKDVEAAVIRGQVVSKIARQLAGRGFKPDLIVGHPGWGETLFLRDVFTQSHLITYCEFFYRADGADVGFDPEYPAKADDIGRLRARNFSHLSAIEAADQGLSPTLWQRSLYPSILQPRIQVLHEGIDTDRLKPDPQAQLRIGPLELKPGDPVVTYVARNLEPYRGFHCFMRALPAIQAGHPDVRVIVVGGDEVSYGRTRSDGQTYRQALTAELDGRVDWSRVHFLGRVPYATYQRVLQVSAVHAYLTYPFVLSWSLLEAMATGCLIVASKTTPVLEVIEDGVNGWLIDFFDTEQLAKQILLALSTPEQTLAMRQQARATVQARFDLHRHCLPRGLELLLQAGH
ncbi:MULTISPECIES: glycosyltransferase family 4 protein [unclassified Cyanobium]|uniref:glycosyltransferase family 4 protein n=1 Tax=unclassified Cyanobium TaxID=2627006 RepID=UPI0020CEABD1|nr:MULTISPECIES: glycosyltransferase family 4 protein [unclassified Cyanobium]MCP9834023.1 glycosyltransferase family 4 protein [Cyanobium sp. La Preciosa 7G6]MCP9936786.1 glycosyltransferase family 4 protein [Cyanobium sp. Aljojuca 7A6]